MERRSVSTLCATELDAAVKHLDIVAGARFGPSGSALQHAPRGISERSELNDRYFFITHCPLFCCRYGTVLPWRPLESRALMF